MGKRTETEHLKIQDRYKRKVYYKKETVLITLAQYELLLQDTYKISNNNV